MTLVTDITAAPRSAYVGLDNRSAGRTAAYLVSQCVGNSSGTILATRSDNRFLGEEEREEGFTQALTTMCPNLRIVSLSGGSGDHRQTAGLVFGAIEKIPDLLGVYSMGGGNRSILDVLDAHRLIPRVYIAHDLDRDNLALLEARRLSFVLHHDLRADLQNVFQSFLHHHRLTAQPPENFVSAIQIVTSENVPHVQTVR